MMTQLKIRDESHRNQPKAEMEQSAAIFTFMTTDTNWPV